VRFKANNGSRYGILEGETIRALKLSPFEKGFSVNDPVFDISTYDLSATELLAPCQPSKYVGVGLNYPEAAKELGMPLPESPLLFLRPSTSVIGPGAEVVFASGQVTIIYEGELAVVIGKEAKNVPEENALDYVLGCTCANDVTDLGKFKPNMLNLVAMKASDTFGPIGPCVDTQVDPAKARVRSWVNGALRQEGNTRELIFGVKFLVSYLSSFMTLLPGDVISTGTPPGAAPVKPGDVVRVEVEGVGILENRMVAAR